MELNKKEIKKWKNLINKNRFNIFSNTIANVLGINKERLLDKIKHKSIVGNFIIKHIKGNKYKIYFKSIFGFPKEIYIENIYFLTKWCEKHGFYLLIENIIFENKNGKQININEININGLNLYQKIIQQIQEYKSDYYKKITEKNKILEKISEKYQEFSRVYIGLNEIIEYFSNIYPNYFKNLKDIFELSDHKRKGGGIMAELILTEIHSRIENHLRDFLGIENTYLNQATSYEDNNEKIDLWLEIDNIKYPIQLKLTSIENINLKSFKDKIKNIEKNIIKYNIFIITGINGNFSNGLKGNKNNFGKIEKAYHKFLHKPGFREKFNITNKHFPLFIDTIEAKYISEPTAMIIFWHLLIKSIKNIKIKNIQIEDIKKNLKNLLEKYNTIKINNILIENISFEIENEEPLIYKNYKNKTEFMKKFLIKVQYKEKNIGWIYLYLK